MHNSCYWSDDFQHLKYFVSGILSCDEFRTFWVSWKTDQVLVGRGPIYGQQVFLNFNRKEADHLHPVNELQFAAGWGAIATWQIRDNSGKDCKNAHFTSVKLAAQLHSAADLP